MRILGIDPGVATIGFGLVEAGRAQVHMVTYGAITTPAGLPLSRRLYQISCDMEELIGQLKPDVISIEELFFNTNITTGIAVAHGRGVILCAAEKCGIPLYEYTPSQVKLAEYIEAYTAPNAVFLTGTRHNNEIASLTGRNIVCGSDSFLYFHGLDTTERKNHLQLMYEAPLEHMELYEKYNVSYVVVSSYERSQYAVAEENIRSLFPRVFSWGDMALYQVRQP